MRYAFTTVVCAAILGGCGHLAEAPLPIQSPPEPPVAATFSVNDADLPDPLVFIAYGDMRFTNPAETSASNPSVRRALVDKIAEEQPAAVFINGDLPWHGVSDDYAQYREESRPWRLQHLRIYPALGNHEFAACAEAQCLERWWSAFPELQGRRWYSVALGSKVLALALDSDASLLPDSDQRRWLEHQLSVIDPRVRLILILLHHPPVADEQSAKLMDHNPRPNEQAFAEYLSGLAAYTRARIVVSAGHIHNYERFVRDGVTYLVSGGGGAKPYEVDRTPADLYQSRDFPNYHYVRFELRPNVLVGEMIRLKTGAPGEPKIGAPAVFEVRDRFELTLLP
ncbi:MAG: metallophosphoesterase family protein [Steroidobacteraceae bacterium]